uniref:Major facilitator superfamily (MFS) profile domain-containing protein n=1 Tax=Panagrolaimus superbus TaxID=310955 RepID=A0A914YR74_9BILA
MDIEIDKKRAELIKGRLTWPLIFSVLAVTIGGSFQFGYHIGCVNAPGNLITEWYRSSHYNMYNTTLSREEADVMWSVSVGIFAVGGMLGGVLSGWFADKLGRKGAILFSNLFVFLAVALMSLAKFVNVYYMMIAGRFVIGFTSGLASSVVPMYLTEVSPINLRGTLGSVNQLLVTIGILVSQILGLPFILGNERYWPLIFAFAIIPAVLQVITLPFAPESPKYNVIVKGKNDQAEKDLKKLRQKPDVMPEVEVIKEEAAVTRNEKKATLASMFIPPLRWPMIIAIMMMLSQQFSGINATMFYSTKIFQDAGLRNNEPFYATIAMGAVNVLMTLVSVWLVDHPKFGRRSLHISGLTGMMISSILIVVSMTFAGEGANTNTFASYASIIFVILFVVAFATGPGSIPWFFVSEIFPSGARGSAGSIACAVNWLANFLVGTFFLPVNNILGKNTFLVFATFLAFFIFFTWKFVPETKGKTIDEINEDLKKPNRSS